MTRLSRAGRHRNASSEALHGCHSPYTYDVRIAQVKAKTRRHVRFSFLKRSGSAMLKKHRAVLPAVHTFYGERIYQTCCDLTE